jgi:hypothetical protein
VGPRLRRGSRLRPTTRRPAWFGSASRSIPRRFVIRGRTTTVGALAPFSYVATLRSETNGSRLALRVYLNDPLVSNSDFTDEDGSGDIWGGTTGPLYEPGRWRYELTDIGGNVLASGTVTAT